jgi:hypothetical protein
MEKSESSAEGGGQEPPIIQDLQEEPVKHDSESSDKVEVAPDFKNEIENKGPPE